MTDSPTISRRRYGAKFKAQVLAECAQAGASVARVALAHGINANVVHKWRRLAGGSQASMAAPAFVPLTLPAPGGVPEGDIHIELHRGPVHVKVCWPVAAAGECALWMRQVLA